MADTTIATGYRFQHPNGVLIAGSGMNGDLATSRITRAMRATTPATSGRPHHEAARSARSGAMLPGFGNMTGAGLTYHVNRRFH